MDTRAGAVDGDAVETAVAVLLGSGAMVWRVFERVTGPLRGAAGGMLSVAIGTAASGATAERGREVRALCAERAIAAVVRVVRTATEIVLPAIDVTELILRHVDLDLLAASLDLDVVVARVDPDAVVARVDLDAAVARVDINAAVARLDLDAVVAQVDVEAVAARLDLDRLAAGLDVAAVVDRIDLDGVAARLDADRIVARIDLGAIVDRLDLVAITRSVIDAIDLPEIVRESTGALSSDAVRAVRAESRRADDRVAGLVDRLLRRSGTSVPVTP